MFKKIRLLGYLALAILMIGGTIAFTRIPPIPYAIGDGPGPWTGGAFPVEKFSSYTSPFGYRQHPRGGYRFHYGLDIAAPRGSYVLNWWDGVVETVDDVGACGTTAIIRSGEWKAIYCHMEGGLVIEKEGGRVLVDRDGGIALRQGSTVKAGDRIGRIGMSGSTTGPHLHWGLKYQDVWLDPAMVLKAMVEGQKA